MQNQTEAIPIQHRPIIPRLTRLAPTQTRECQNVIPEIPKSFSLGFFIPLKNQPEQEKPKAGAEKSALEASDERDRGRPNSAARPKT